jgi:hypothetical protein
MPEEPTKDVESESETPNLTDVLFDKLGLAEMTISLMVNGMIREEILRALIRSGALTAEEVAATLDRADKEVADFCDRILASHPGEHTTEIVQKMRDRGQSVTDGTRERVINSSSSSPD